MKNFLGKILMGSAYFACLVLNADISQPYASVRHLPQTPYYVQDGYVFNSLIASHQAAIVVDVESQDGGVARFVAQQLNNLPTVTTIYSVNAWSSPDPSQKHLYQRFLSNVVQEMTTEFIHTIRMSSLEAAESLNIRADFISLVGGNDQKGIYQDILAWYPHLTNNGVISGNNWNDVSVQSGVIKAAQVLDLIVQVSGNVWYFEKGK